MSKIKSFFQKTTEIINRLLTYSSDYEVEEQLEQIEEDGDTLQDNLTE